MDGERRRRILVFSIVLLALAAVRTAYIFYDRSRPAPPPAQPPAIALTEDDYVTPSRIVPYDLKSAVKELAGKTVWVRHGNAIPYYRYRPASRSVEFTPQAGLLPPLARLQVKDVVLQAAPVALRTGEVRVVRKQVMAVFEDNSHPGVFAVSIGNCAGDDFTFNVNDVFYYEDPHQLYKHWPAEVWSAIDRHEAQKGMNELQVSFALGDMAGATVGDYGNRSAQYRVDGGRVNVTFEKNRATRIEPVSR